MKKYGLIGFPLTHSFSKKFFAEKFSKENIQGVEYENYPLGDIAELKLLLQREPALAGLNVTIPYKEKVLAYIDVITDDVKQMGACNCIRIEDSTLVGHNTDALGFEKSLKKKLKAYHKNALILGTGGAAKAVCYVLTRIGIPYQMVSRNPGEHQLDYDSLNPEIMATHQLIINTTPLGMYPEVDSFPPIPYEYLGQHHYLFDLVYNPRKTLFLSKGELKGAVIENGADMLVYQAEASWEIWTK